jgi:hypothetical protein
MEALEPSTLVKSRSTQRYVLTALAADVVLAGELRRFATMYSRAG